MVARLKAAYRYATASFAGHGSSVLWTMIAEKQADIHAALLADDDSLASLLADPCGTYLYYGVDNLYPAFRDTGLQSPQHQSLELAARDALATLAEALGADRSWNPEGGALFPHKEPKPTRGADDLLSDIENALGATLDFPSPFPGELGLSTARGVVTYRAVHAIYQAHRLNLDNPDEPVSL